MRGPGGLGLSPKYEVCFSPIACDRLFNVPKNVQIKMSNINGAFTEKPESFAVLILSTIFRIGRALAVGRS